MGTGSDQHEKTQTAVVDVNTALPDGDNTDHAAWTALRELVQVLEREFEELHKTAHDVHDKHQGYRDKVKGQLDKHQQAASVAPPGQRDQADKGHTAATNHLQVAEDHAKGATSNKEHVTSAKDELKELVEELEKLLGITQYVHPDAPQAIKDAGKNEMAGHHSKVKEKTAKVTEHVDAMAETKTSLDDPEEIHKDDPDAQATMQDPQS
jgi:ElaB/YqjD/DUF883 family membrane-anchored ribosome-binding protein